MRRRKRVLPLPGSCAESVLDRHGRAHFCIEEPAHAGDHVDAKGFRWEPPRVILQRLHRAWGRTHRVVWTGRMWIATAHRRDAHWRTEVQPTPGQLEEILRRHGYTPATPQEQR